MRIVNVGINLVAEAGGIARSVELFVAAQEEAGNISQVISFGRRGFYEPDAAGFRRPDTKYIRVPRVPVLERCYWWPGGYAGAAGLFGSADLLVIHGLFFHPGVLAARWARKAGVPYLVVAHGSLDPVVFSYRAWRKQAWMWQAGKRLLRRASAVIYSTRAEQRKAARWTGGGGYVIHWPAPFAPGYDKAAAVRRVQATHGLPPTARIALTCGRIHPIKRPLETIAAFGAAAPPDWVLLVVGPATPEIPRAAIEDACRAAGGRCLYAGAAFGEALADYYRAAELFVLFSKKENFSHVTAEALAFGVPVLVSSGVDLAEDLAGSGARCAFIAEDSGPEALAASLAAALACPAEELRRMGGRGREWVRENLSLARFRSRLSELYSGCLREAEGRRRG